MAGAVFPSYAATALIAPRSRRPKVSLWVLTLASSW
jgi:hypothetical protein